MPEFRDRFGRTIRLADERRTHLETEHPEMRDQVERIAETLIEPDRIIRSRTDAQAGLYYRWYPITPVTTKFLCVVVRVFSQDPFILTAYYTDTIKQGAIIWEKP